MDTEKRVALARARRGHVGELSAIMLTEAALYGVGLLPPGWPGLALAVCGGALAYFVGMRLETLFHYYHTIPLEMWRQEATDLRGQLDDMVAEVANLWGELAAAGKLVSAIRGTVEMAPSLTLTSLVETTGMQVGLVAYVDRNRKLREPDFPCVIPWEGGATAKPLSKGVRETLWLGRPNSRHFHFTCKGAGSSVPGVLLRSDPAPGEGGDLICYEFCLRFSAFGGYDPQELWVQVHVNWHGNYTDPKAPRTSAMGVGLSVLPDGPTLVEPEL